MKKLIYTLFGITFLFSCSDKKNEISVHERIDMYEDSINQWGGGLGSEEQINSFASDYIQTLLEAYNEDKKNPKSPMYLDRIHMWYSAVGDDKNAAKYGEILLQEYPKYENREMVLESVATLYDCGITPRDSNKVSKYYIQLLTEFPNLEKDKKASIEKRLLYNHLSFEDYLMRNVSKEIDSITP